MTLEELNARLEAREEEMIISLFNEYRDEYDWIQFRECVPQIMDDDCSYDRSGILSYIPIEEARITSVEEFLKLPSGEREPTFMSGMGWNYLDFADSLFESVESLLRESLDQDDEEDDFYDLLVEWRESLTDEVKERLDDYIKQNPIQGDQGFRDMDDEHLFGHDELEAMRQDRIDSLLDAHESDLEIMDNSELFGEEEWNDLREQRIAALMLGATKESRSNGS